MTKEEAAVLVHAAPPEIVMHFRPTNDVRLVALKAKPCPLYAFNTCLVYEHRPFNCRRFGCMRPDVKAEKWDGQNMEVRTKTSRIARRMAEKLQRKAQRWAVRHGWPTS